MDTQLLVIGDSHVDFWNGTGDWHEADSIPGVRSTAIPNALAWDLAEEVSTSNARQAALNAISSARQDGFAGWVMLSFGNVDCDTFIWRQTQAVGFEAAVKRTVDRYVDFIVSARSLYGNIAVWGPITRPESDAAVIGNRNERNLAVLVFTGILQQRLASLDVPMLTIAEEVLGAESETQALLPQAVALVNETLQLHIGRGASPLELSELAYDRFDQVAYVRSFEKTWLQFDVPEGAQFFTDLSIDRSVYAEVGSIGIATTWDGKSFEHEEVAFSNGIADVDNRQRVHIQRYARKILVHGSHRPVNANELSFFVRGTLLPAANELSREELLAMRDTIVVGKPVPGESRTAVEQAAPAAASIMETVIFSEPPSMGGVVFSAPPDRTLGVIFSAPPGTTLAPAAEEETKYVPTVSETVEHRNVVRSHGPSVVPMFQYSIA